MLKIELVFIVLLSLLLSACDGAVTENEKNKSKFQQPFKTMLVYPKKNTISDFKLVLPDLAVFNQNNLRGKWSLLFIGYTNCPDVCPTTLTDLTNIYNKIAANLQEQTQVIFLSVDPERDTPEHLGQYISYFNDDFVAITGDKLEIDKLVRTLGGVYAVNKSEGDFYTVDHSARIFLINPLGQRYGMVTSEAMLNKDRTLLVKELHDMLASKVE